MSKKKDGQLGTHFSSHDEKVEKLQEAIRQNKSLVSFQYGKGYSNTCHSKRYKQGRPSLNCSSLDQILSVDLEKRRIRVEPRVTMEALVKATLPHNLAPLIVPEFKGITVGGAIMGAAAESSSHKWGIFHDSCMALEFIDGQGNLIQASASKNADLFYGISGSYGSLGLAVSAEIALMPVAQSVHVIYHTFSDLQCALKKIEDLIDHCDFLDGILFQADHIVIMEGSLTSEKAEKASSKWFAPQVRDRRASGIMPLFDYFFRYDQGAFWMGRFLYSLSFLARYICQGIFKAGDSQGYFTAQEIKLFKDLGYPGALMSSLSSSFMGSQSLWRLLHKARKWVEDRLIIQDFCIPLSNALTFITAVLQNNCSFPIWICPIKGATTKQILAPHYGNDFYINFGIYGVPSHPASMKTIIHPLEELTYHYGGRKVLYSRSFYDRNTFWKIYRQDAYQQLREKSYAQGIWPDITDKVL